MDFSVLTRLVANQSWDFLKFVKGSFLPNMTWDIVAFVRLHDK